MSDERPGGEARLGEDKGEDENAALTEWTAKDELKKEDEHIGTDDVPKLANPPG